MKNTHTLLLSLMILTFAACEQIIDLRDPDYKPQLFVYGLVSPDDKATLFFTETQQLEGWIEQINETIYPEDLNPVIEAGGSQYSLEGKEVFFAPLWWRDEDSTRAFAYQGAENLPDSGRYQLSLQYKEQTISGSTTVPRKNKIDSAYSQVLTFEDIGGSWSYTVLRVELTDLAGSEEMYRIHYGYRGVRRDFIIDSINNSFIWDTIPAIEDYYSPILLDDDKDGQPISLDFNPSINMVPEEETLPDGSTRRFYRIWLILETHGPESKAFLRSLEEQQYASGDPFIEPVFLQGNIKGGTGVFGAFRQSDTLWIKYYD
ncbi:MAG: DUF4249 family protein [Bacteroidota bacterium]